MKVLKVKHQEYDSTTGLHSAFVSIEVETYGVVKAIGGFTEIASAVEPSKKEWVKAFYEQNCR